LVEAGLGGATLALAPHVAELWVCHPWLDLARLIERRAARAGHDHVIVCGGVAGPSLSFAEGSFDGVVVHDLHDLRARLFPGVEQALNAFVLDLKRVLNPDGFLMLDGRLRGLLAPRGGESVRRGTVHRALKAAGLARRSDLAFRFSHGQPYLIQNTRGALPLRTRLRHWVVGELRTPVAGFVATSGTGATAPSLLDGVLRQLPLHESDFQRARETVHLGSWDVFRAETAELVVRMPASPVGVDRCRRNAQALRELAATPLPFATPRLACEGAWRGMMFVAETRLPGQAVDYLHSSRREREQISGNGQAMLADMYDRTRRVVRLDAGVVRELFVDPLDRIAEYLEPAVAELIREARDWLSVHFTGADWTLARTHGDYKVSNFLTDRRGRISGVVDWDLSRPDGLPMTDSILLEAFDRSMADGVFFGRAVYNAGFGSLEWRERLPDSLRRYIVDENRWRATALATLVDYFFHNLGPESRWSPFIRSEFSEMVGHACRRLIA
jgi:aminoglycoside phosphotransferase (APT) family kinase protein